MDRSLQAALAASLVLGAACGDEDGPLDAGHEGSWQPDGGDGGVPPDDGGGDPLEVTTTQGRVRGIESMGARAFLGIPYAAPPIGDKRWKAPEPAAPWSETREATSYGSLCTQLRPNNAAYDSDSGEDCLSVNVWAPLTPASVPLPVMVWIHGGAYIFGSGGPPYNGETLVREGNVIVVTMNYRMGELGFLAHPAITAEARAESAPAANFGLLDQRLALQWVRDNIAAFGGDAANVTLFGESAGANSVCAHLVSEGSRGLFQKAIVESGLCMKPFLTLAEAEAKGQAYAVAKGCTDPAQALSCLRQLTTQQLLEHRLTSPTKPPSPGGLFYQDPTTAFAMQPIIDGTVLPEQPEQAFAAGRIAKVPVLHGINSAEGALFHEGVLGDKPPTSAAEYEQILSYRFGARAADIVARYPELAQLTDVTSAALFVCPARRMANHLSAAGVTNYLYRFDLPVDIPIFPVLQNRAFHSAELPYVFGNDYLLGKVPDAHKDEAMQIRAYWTQFAATGNPNSTRTVHWPAYAPATGAFLNLAPTIGAGMDWDSACADFWDGVPVSPP